MRLYRREEEKEDSLAAARGILNGLLLGLVFWGIIIGVMIVARYL